MKLIGDIAIMLGLMVLAALGWGVVFGMMGGMGIGNNGRSAERKEKK